MIFDLPEAYYTLLLKRSFKDQVIVTTTKKNIKNHKVKVLGLGDLLKSKKPTFFKDKLIRKWFFYWMVRGVFSKKDEPLFHFLKFEYHED